MCLLWKAVINIVLTAWCLIPVEEVSRPVDDVLFEIAQLADQGVREINLLGQNVNAYRGPTFDGGICTFAELLRLVASIDGIDRLRLPRATQSNLQTILLMCIVTHQSWWTSYTYRYKLVLTVF